MASQRDKVFLRDHGGGSEGGDGSEESPEFQCYKYLPRREFPVSLIRHTS